MTAETTIVICDDHALVRSGIRRLIESEPGLSVRGEASNSEEALAQVVEHRPDVLLLDVTMPGRSGIEVLREIIAAAPATRVLMLSMHDDAAYVRQALAGGASGYLLKDAADADLVKALNEVRDGRRYLHPALGARLAATETVTAVRPVENSLSDREHQVLRMLALGHTNQEIATTMSLSVRTAETLRAKIVNKLGLRTRAELVRYALESGELEHATADSGDLELR